jgi:hypothetical protein
MNEEDLRHELELLALSEAASGRARLAKVTALRTLERLRRASDEDYPVDDEGRFHPGPSAWWDLDRCDSDHVRDAWRTRLSR